MRKAVQSLSSKGHSDILGICKQCKAVCVPVNRKDICRKCRKA